MNTLDRVKGIQEIGRSKSVQLKMTFSDALTMQFVIVRLGSRLDWHETSRVSPTFERLYGWGRHVGKQLWPERKMVISVMLPATTCNRKTETALAKHRALSCSRPTDYVN